jgi:diguanylate cyclase (GGDEF)-like protein
LGGKSIFTGRRGYLFRKHARRLVLRLGGCFLSISLATASVRILPQSDHFHWLANGVWLGYLLLAPRRRWPMYLTAGFVAQLLAGFAVNVHWRSNLQFVALDLAGVWLSALILRRYFPLLTRSEDREFQHSLINAIHGASPDGILVVDAKENVVSYNQRFVDVWKLSLLENPHGRLQHNVFLADKQILAQAVGLIKDPEEFIRRIKELYANRDEEDHCEIELKDGRTLERYSSCLHNDEDAYMGRVWFFRDISDRKHAAKALEGAYRAVELMAITDSLTGLANRRRFDQCLSVEWRRGLRDQLPLSLLLIDVDMFKLYNDTYGHLRGDHCLKQIAETALGVVVRVGDLVARFGGEEFTVLLPNTGMAGAAHVAEGIGAALRAREIPQQGTPLGIVTVSIGCATLVPHMDLCSAHLIDFADEALYAAKRNGRNSVRSFSQLTGGAGNLRPARAAEIDPARYKK